MADNDDGAVGLFKLSDGGCGVLEEGLAGFGIDELGGGVKVLQVIVFGEGGALVEELGLDQLVCDGGPFSGGGEDGDGRIVVELVLEGELAVEEMGEAGLEDHEEELADDSPQLVVELLGFLQGIKPQACESIIAEQLEPVQK